MKCRKNHYRLKTEEACNRMKERGRPNHLTINGKKKWKTNFIQTNNCLESTKQLFVQFQTTINSALQKNTINHHFSNPAKLHPVERTLSPLPKDNQLKTNLYQYYKMPRNLQNLSPAPILKI